MNLLAAKLYDPAVAVSKATSSLLAMTAFDTTNLRLAITVPAHGMVFFRMRCQITGATTVPTILLGVMNGATVIGRVTPRDYPGTMNAATQTTECEAEFTATGLTPGAMNVDAAYAVQVIVASTNIKYGGPNTNAGANAWGAFVFEAWDPQPQSTTAQLAVDSGGRVSANVTQVNGTAQTARDLGAQLDAAVSTRMATYTQPTGFLAATFPTSVASPTNITSASGVALAASQHVIVDSGTITNLTNLPAIPANWLTAAGIAAGALNGKGDWLLASSYTAPPSAAAIRTEIDANSVGLAAIFARTDVATSTRSVYAGADTAGTTTLLARLTALRAAALDNVDATVSSRLAGASYTAPDNTSVAAAATAAAAIKLKTDQLAFTVAGKVDANLYHVNGVAVTGAGTAASPWGP